jgi:predicted DNA-binding protein
MTANKKKPEKKQYGVRLKTVTMKKLKHLSIDVDKKPNSLLEEAVEDLLKKYDNKESVN